MNKIWNFVQHRALSSSSKWNRDILHSLHNGKNIFYHPLESNRSGVLVVLFGWLGGQQKYLKKYVDFWSNKNVDVLCYCVRWRDILFPCTTMDVKARQLAQSLFESQHLYPSILFHTFSSGCYYYATLNEILLQNPELGSCAKNIKGVICDSLGDWTYTLTHRKSLTGFLGPWASPLPVGRVKRDYENALKSKTDLFPFYLRHSPFNFDKFHDKNNMFLANPFDIPGLFLYSESDLLTDPSRVRRIAKHWEERGIYVSTQHWEKSEHVQHYRLHQQTYERKVELFAARTLKRNVQ